MVLPNLLRLLSLTIVCIVDVYSAVGKTQLTKYVRTLLIVRIFVISVNMSIRPGVFWVWK